MSDKTAFEVGRLYQPIKAIADTLVASQKDIFVRLPGLVAYYPMGIRLAGNVVEHGGSGLVLSQTGTCQVGFDGNAFTHLGNGTNYVQSTSAQFGITGLETWINPSLRGLTVGGWFMTDSSPALDSGFISKDQTSPNRGYVLGWQAADNGFFQVTGTGAAMVTAFTPGLSLGVWNFIVGRFTPSTEVAIFSNSDKGVNTTAVPASQFVSPQAFNVGRYYADNARIVHGKARDVFVCASALSDQVIEQLRVTSVP